ncbi:efflux transporter outer membrane subunit [Xylophilus sp. GOD-11R]|uniref:efflux transporter outer membrane subunit n=1 Tax=Xylophilus sp. GOD-11R TaxID=3089814 RepID=UPI00298CD053|nr:efflux transporter outer membrane subunit [Xylophilus sp. GOD-11R]WPB56851.1 efflux transporter outer membrane subunit [Xylophilus sp. GOD-11R]
MNLRLPSAGLAASCLALLGGCALQRPPAQVPITIPAGWQAPLPHGGSVADMTDWWKRLDDPLLVQLIAAAEDASPTLAQARSRLLQARATRVVNGAATLPSVNLDASIQRGFNAAVLGIATQMQAGPTVSWDADLFGAAGASRDAAEARLQGARAGWHDARVAVAADVANQLDTVRNCRRLLAVAESDAKSRAETARLSDLSAKAGFQAPADAALARGSAADGDARLIQQRAGCEVNLKALVALTALDEPDLRRRVDAAVETEPVPAVFTIASLPAAVLEQRPDLRVAALEVAAASAEVGSAQAQRYPRLRLQGSVSQARLNYGGQSFDFSNWQVGPVALSLPIFDGGRLAANVDSAKARYDEAAAQFRAKARQAVREVEEALVNLQAATDRIASAETAAEGYKRALAGTQARYDAGLATLIALEDVRRTALASETARVNLRRERMAAWIALYRAAGGGWDPASPAPGDPPGTAVSAAPAKAVSSDTPR